MNDKTVVERLREDAKRAREERGLTVYTPDQLEKFADAIEREYLPRPRFDDGEPVQFGDAYTDKYGRVWENGIRSVHIECNGDFSLHSYTRGHSGMFEEFGQNDCVKRPEPEILDADGVPIRVGDTVWNVNTGKYLVVDGLGERWFCAIGDTIKYNPLMFSHKQPDSLERIEEDAEKTTRDYWECYGTDCLSCPARVDEKNPRERYGAGRCQTAMTLDLLYRQRKVLARDNIHRG